MPKSRRPTIDIMIMNLSDVRLTDIIPYKSVELK